MIMTTITAVISVGLHNVLGELDVEVLNTDSCDEARWATMLGWHAKYDRMRAVFLGSKDPEVQMKKGGAVYGECMGNLELFYRACFVYEEI